MSFLLRMTLQQDRLAKALAGGEAAKQGIGTHDALAAFGAPNLDHRAARFVFMAEAQSVQERVAELAAFLDPEAFAQGSDGPLAHRREAAWQEARNRVERSEAPLKWEPLLPTA
jgi:hypothetical protein